MASSNRHWPSMFKSKPCNSSQYQWQHDINSSSLISSNGCQRSTPPNYASSGCEERSPEPKPRWNPRPEQIRILEAIFNSGMVNPPRDEIRKIRAQLQEYGQVGDANVFYWFQNRKSRSKHKQRHVQTTTNNKLSQPPLTKKTTLSSSSSSSERSSQNSADRTLSLGSNKNVMDASSSPTASVNQQQQPFFHPHSGDFLSVPFFFPVQPPPPPPTPTPPVALSQGFIFPDSPNLPHVHLPADNNNTIPTSSTSLLLSDLLLMNHAPTKKLLDDDDDDNKVNKLHHQPLGSYTLVNSPPNATTTTQSQTVSFTTTTNATTVSTIDYIQGVSEAGSTKSTVFINDVAFEVTSAEFNVRDAFGDDAVLLHSSGQPVLTNEWGVTLEPLHHGAFYYLIRTLTSSHHHDSTSTHLI